MESMILKKNRGNEQYKNEVVKWQNIKESEEEISTVSNYSDELQARQ